MRCWLLCYQAASALRNPSHPLLCRPLLPVLAHPSCPSENLPPTSTLEPSPTPPPTPTPLPEVRVREGEQALRNGDWEQAIAEYKLAYDGSSDPDLSAEALLGLARSYLSGRNEYEAIAKVEQLLADHPEAHQVPAAHFVLAQAFSRQERFAEAAEEYRTYIVLHPGVIDSYIWNLRADALFDAGDYATAAVDYQAALGAPGVLDDIQLRLKLARSYALTGDFPTALTLYDDIYNRTESEYTRALVNLRKGQAYTELGQIDQAHEAYLDSVNRYPGSYDTYSALIALVEAGIEVNALQRGIVDYYAGQYGPAMAAFDSYLQADPADPGTARYFYGLAARAQGNFSAAIEQWDAIITEDPAHALWDDAWEQKAYTQWAHLSLYDDAIRTLIQFTEQSDSHPRAAEFIFDAAQVAEQNDDLSQAIELWERQASEYPNDERTVRSRFLAALARYRQGDYPAAQNAFERFLSVAVSLEDRAAGNFWAAKSALAKDDPESARTTFQTAASIDPTGYYSERARDYLHDRGLFEPPIGYDLGYDLNAERDKAAEWVKTTFNLPPETDLSGPGDLADDPSLQRGLELWELGLYDDARGEFEVLRTRSQSDPARTFRLIQLFIDLGAYRPGIMAARQVLDLAGLDEAAMFSAPAYFNHIRFGSYFPELVMPLAQDYGFHPLFIFSLVRQESLFEGFVNSSAGARGLMQIMPATGDEIAANLGWPDEYSSDDLYRPLVSLRLGMDYLDGQRALFDGDLFAALAAYNGGPGNAAAWHSLAPDDPDLFLEFDPIRRDARNTSSGYTKTSTSTG